MCHWGGGRIVRSLNLILLTLILAGCTGGLQSSKALSSTVKVTAICTSGDQESCNATNGTGTAICDASGNSWGACTVKSCNTGYGLLSGVCRALQQYVALNGNDQATGDISNPLATIAMAQTRIQQLKAANPGQILPLSVTIRGGTYYLTQPLQFTALDSGWAGAPIVYSSYPGEKVIISGGVPVTNWTAISGAPTYQAPLPALPFRQLYVGDTPGIHPIRARYPKTTYLTEEQYNISGTTFSINVSPDASISSGAVNVSNAELVIVKSFTQSRWGIGVISGPTADGGFTVQANAASGATEAAIGAGYDVPNQRLYFEGTVSLLTQPGEWAISGNQIVYYPHAGEYLAGTQVVAPQLTQLVLVGVDGQAQVSNLTFSGIEFHHTTWNQPTLTGYAGTQGGTFVENGTYAFAPASFQITNATGISVTNCRFAQLGGGGIELVSSVSNTNISGNMIDDVAANGITLSDHLNNNPTTSLNNNIGIVNNIIEYVAQNYDGVGIFLGFTQNVTVANNLIQHMPYDGIEVNLTFNPVNESGAFGSNSIALNEITDVMNFYTDGGAIYLASYNPNTTVYENYIHDIYRQYVPSGVGPQGFQIGLYMDGYAQGYNAPYNCFLNVAAGTFMQPASWAPANNNIITSAHMNNVAVPIADSADVTPAFLAANNDQLVYDNNWAACSTTVSTSGPAASVRSQWSAILSGPVYPAGWFYVASTFGVGYSDGSSWCAYTILSDFASASGMADVSTLQVFPSAPSGEKYTGACPAYPTVDPATSAQ